MKIPDIMLTFLCLTLIFSCTKEEGGMPAQLEVSVVNETSAPLAGAIVTLYNNETDWTNRINAVQSGETDADGIITFTDLDIWPLYCIYAEKDPLSNYFSDYQLDKVLKKNQLTKVTVTVK